MKRYSRFGLMGIVLCSLAGAAMAQTEEVPTVTFKSSGTPGFSKAMVTIDAEDIWLEVLAKNLTEQSQVPIIVEPGLDKRVTAQVTNREFEAALTQLLGENGPHWTRVEVVHPANQAYIPDATLFSLARTFTSMPSDSMTVKLSEGRGEIALMRRYSGTTTNSPIASGMKRQALYVITRRHDEVAGGIEEELAGVAPSDSENVTRATVMNQRRLELMQSMSPGERQAAIQQEMMSMLSLSPEARRQMMQDRRNAIRSLPDDVRQQMRGMWPGGRGGGRDQGRRNGPRTGTEGATPRQ